MKLLKVIRTSQTLRKFCYILKKYFSSFKTFQNKPKKKFNKCVYTVGGGAMVLSPHPL